MQHWLNFGVSYSCAQKCCYTVVPWKWYTLGFDLNRWNWVKIWHGSLIVSTTYQAGGLYEKNPFYYPYDALEKEDKAKKDCCLLSNNCPAYYRVRPIDTCDKYNPPRAISELITNY